MAAKIPHFESMEEKELNYIKVNHSIQRGPRAKLINIQMIDAGESLIVNNCSFGYLSHRIVFYLLNLHIKQRHAYFVRVRDRVRTSLFELAHIG